MWTLKGLYLKGLFQEAGVRKWGETIIIGRKLDYCNKRMF
jgi:hypothetical protein